MINSEPLNLGQMVHISYHCASLVASLHIATKSRFV